MESIVEFALYTWVAVSILAVLVQLVRIVRYRRSNAAKAEATPRTAVDEGASASSLPKTIDLDRPDARAAASTSDSAVADDRTVAASSSATSVRSGAAPTAPPPPSRLFTDAPAPAPPAAPTPAPPEPPASSAPPDPAPPTTPAPPPSATSPDPAPPAPPEPPPEPTPPEPTPAEPAPAEPTATLADLLAGVRLPWNLLPTVDQSREPSNDRVVLLTADSEPATVGADVADELERLGFSITTRGEDTAIATRGDHVLGLQIIPDAAGVEAGEQPRFPAAGPNSVALDIWIER